MRPSKVPSWTWTVCGSCAGAASGSSTRVRRRPPWPGGNEIEAPGSARRDPGVVQEQGIAGTEPERLLGEPKAARRVAGAGEGPAEGVGGADAGRRGVGAAGEEAGALRAAMARLVQRQVHVGVHA